LTRWDVKWQQHGADKPNFAAARARAVAQTAQEWCRLTDLVRSRYGEAGVHFLFANWVEDTAEARAVCKFRVFLPLVLVGR